METSREKKIKVRKGRLKMKKKLLFMVTNPLSKLAYLIGVLNTATWLVGVLSNWVEWHWAYHSASGAILLATMLATVYQSDEYELDEYDYEEQM
jgi:hypothetical protein